MLMPELVVIVTYPSWLDILSPWSLYQGIDFLGRASYVSSSPFSFNTMPYSSFNHTTCFATRMFRTNALCTELQVACLNTQYIHRASRDSPTPHNFQYTCCSPRKIQVFGDYRRRCNCPVNLISSITLLFVLNSFLSCFRQMALRLSWGQQMLMLAEIYFLGNQSS